MRKSQSTASDLSGIAAPNNINNSKPIGILPSSLSSYNIKSGRTDKSDPVLESKLKSIELNDFNRSRYLVVDSPFESQNRISSISYEIDVIHEEPHTQPLPQSQQPNVIVMAPVSDTAHTANTLATAHVNNTTTPQHDSSVDDSMMKKNGDYRLSHTNLIQPSSSSSTSSLSNANTSTTTHTNSTHTAHNTLSIVHNSSHNSSNGNNGHHQNSNHANLKLSSAHSSNTASSMANSLNNNEPSNTSQTSSPINHKTSHLYGSQTTKAANTPTKASNRLSGFLHSISFNFVNAGSNTSNNNVKLRASKKKNSKSSQENRISLPPNYNNNSLYSNQDYSGK